MTSSREWRIEITSGPQGEDVVEVLRNGAWFSDADDIDDAIGVLNGQRATSVTVVQYGYTQEVSL